ncbi:MAG TPA: phosphoribosylformylglycinamidine synthase I [Tepidisphaeraceae bacterium]|jgi:phosphoribosylformylglycinamidine synthase
MKPRTLILRTAGTNCDLETAAAFESAGSTADRIHLNRILDNPAVLDDYQILAIAGGFSYGDDIAAGRILANQITHHLREPLRRFVEADKCVIGICNGFQVLAKTDLLPGGLAGQGGQTATLTHNDCGRFVCEWVPLRAVGSKCVWTAGLGDIELPIAHGEGKFLPQSDAVLQSLKDADQIALVYAGANPNGSAADVAGVCDSTGRVFGLMPHPERYVSALQHPAWTSRGDDGEGPGLAMFRNAVRYAQQAAGAGV